MKKRSGFYPRVHVGGEGVGVVSSAGGLLVTAAVRVSGLDTGLSQKLRRWRTPNAVHDPAKVLTRPGSSVGVGW